MEEKKRKRPTVMQVRTLEAEIDALKKLRAYELRKRLSGQEALYNALLEKYDILAEKMNALSERNRQLSHDNTRLAAYNADLVRQTEKLTEERDDARKEAEHLKGRSLWQRLFNV